MPCVEVSYCAMEEYLALSTFPESIYFVSDSKLKNSFVLLVANESG